MHSEISVMGFFVKIFLGIYRYFFSSELKTYFAVDNL